MLCMVLMYSTVKRPRKPIYVFFVEKRKKVQTLAVHILKEKN